MKKVIYTLLLFLLSAGMAVSQISFTASTDAKKILQNSTVSVTFKLENAKGTGFVPPKFKGLQKLQGPSTSSSMSIINGRSTSSKAFTYTLLGTKIGTYTIGPASIKVKGKLMQTKPITIEVVKGKPNAGAIAESGKKKFIKVTLSDSVAIIGQQISMVYDLYFQEDIRGYDFVRQIDYDGFYALTTRNKIDATRREIMDGEEFYVKTIRTLMLFPQQTGTFTLDADVVQLSVPIPGSRGSGFFNIPATRREQIVTKEQTIKVIDYPTPVPELFSGAVGKYRMQAKIVKNKITTDDAIVINMAIRGNGDSRTVSAPKQPTQPNLEYYDPSVTAEEPIRENGVYDDYKEIEYLVVPNQPGRYTLRPEFTYYDTDSSKYVVLRSGPFEVDVTAGTRKVTKDDRDLSTLGQLKPKKNTEHSINIASTYFRDNLLYGGIGVFLLGSLGLFLWKRKLEKEDAVDPIVKRKNAAQQIAKERLARAKMLLDKGDNRAFYNELSTAMNGYLADKYQIPNVDRTKSKVTRHLQDKNVSQAVIDDYLSLLQRCEMAAYAGQADGADQSYEQAVGIISKLN